MRSCVVPDAGRAQGVDDDTLDSCDRLVALHPENPRVYVRRAVVRLAAARSDTERPMAPEVVRLALDDYDRAIDLAPGSVDARMARAQLHVDNRDFDRALNDLHAVLNLDPDNMAARALRVDALLSLGEHGHLAGTAGSQAAYEQALEDCDVFVSRAPDLAMGHLRRARVLVRLEDLEGALDECNATLSLSPTLVEAYLERAAVHVARGYPRKAMEDCDRVIDLAPGDVRGYLGRGDAFGQLGDLYRAEASYRQAAEVDADNTAAHLGRAITLVALGRRFSRLRHFEKMRDYYQQAIRYSRMAIRLDESNPWTHGHLGRALRGLDGYDHAILAFDGALARAADDRALVATFLGERGETLRLWAALADDSSALKQASISFKKAVALAPASAESAWIHEGMGCTLIDRRDFKEALAAFERAIQLDSDYGWALVGKGRAYYLLGDLDRAARVFGDVLALDARHDLYVPWAEVGRWLSTSRLGESGVSFGNARVQPETLLYLERADILDQFGVHRLAEQERRAALRVAPESIDACCALAWTCLRYTEGDAERDIARAGEAGRLATRALELDVDEGNRSDSLHLLGWAHLCLGDRAAAREHLEEAHRLQPLDLLIRLHLEQAVTAGHVPSVLDRSGAL
jgi:tetratricopeptide (TPR) repeat protein